MFIKPFSKYNKTTGEHHTIYQLCESYRVDGRTRHHLIVGLGKLEEKLHTVEEIKRLGKRIEEKLKGENILMPDSVDDSIEMLAHHYYVEIKKKRCYDTGKGGKDCKQ